MAVASVPEFIPRGISSATYAKNLNEPEIVEILHSKSPTVGGELLNASYSDPNVSADGDLATSNIATYQVSITRNVLSNCSRVDECSVIIPAQENVNGTVYFYTAPLTQSNNASPVDGLSASPTLIADSTEGPLISGPAVVTPDGVNPILTQSIIPDPTGPVYYIQDGLNTDVLLMQQNSELYTGFVNSIFSTEIFSLLFRVNFIKEPLVFRIQNFGNLKRVS